MGDFNSIVSQKDGVVGSEVQKYELKGFRNFVLDCHISELPTVGRFFTWTNGHGYSRINKALVNAT